MSNITFYVKHVKYYVLRETCQILRITFYNIGQVSESKKCSTKIILPLVRKIMLIFIIIQFSNVVIEEKPLINCYEQ